jgi:hypothetical protein
MENGGTTFLKTKTVNGGRLAVYGGWKTCFLLKKLEGRN